MSLKPSQKELLKNSWYHQRWTPPPYQNEIQPLKIPKAIFPLYFVLCWRIWTNYLHMCQEEPPGNGAKKNILLTEHKQWLHPTLRATRSDALHMLTWHGESSADNMVTSPRRPSLSSYATCSSVSEMRRWISNGSLMFAIANEVTRRRIEGGRCLLRPSVDKGLMCRWSVFYVHGDGVEHDPRAPLRGLMCFQPVTRGTAEGETWDGAEEWRKEKMSRGDDWF